jgi:hypothetical protein
LVNESHPRQTRRNLNRYRIFTVLAFDFNLLTLCLPLRVLQDDFTDQQQTAVAQLASVPKLVLGEAELDAIASRISARLQSPGGGSSQLPVATPASESVYRGFGLPLMDMDTPPGAGVALGAASVRSMAPSESATPMVFAMPMPMGTPARTSIARPAGPASTPLVAPAYPATPRFLPTLARVAPRPAMAAPPELLRVVPTPAGKRTRSPPTAAAAAAPQQPQQQQHDATQAPVSLSVRSFVSRRSLRRRPDAWVQKRRNTATVAAPTPAAQRVLDILSQFASTPLAVRCALPSPHSVALLLTCGVQAGRAPTADAAACRVCADRHAAARTPGRAAIDGRLHALQACSLCTCAPSPPSAR